MCYGYFDDEQRKYVIECPDIPLPWINYLGSKARRTTKVDGLYPSHTKSIGLSPDMLKSHIHLHNP